jgi:hypothetical protein
MSIVPNFIQLESDGLEFVVETNLNLAYASKRATARMLNIDESTVRKDLTCGNYTVVTASIPTEKGMQSADLIPAHVVFKLAIKRNPELAEKMGEAGANIYMLKAAGYEIKVVETAQEAHPIADPTKLGRNFFAWDERKSPQVLRVLKKIVKANKGKAFLMLREDVSGLCIQDIYNAQTGARLYSFFAYMANVSAVVEMQRFTQERLNAGAKLVVRN